MSAQTIITTDNLPTDYVMSQYLTEKSVDLLKNVRFEIGCLDRDKLREMLRLERLICSGFCYVDSDESESIRERAIRNAINEIYEI